MQAMEPTESLKKILADRGVDVLEQPDVVEALLQDYCPASKPDIYLLVSSLKEGVPQRLIAARTSTRRDAVIGQVREEMQVNLGMQPQKAQWTVNAWLKALPTQGNQPPEPPKPAPVPPPVPQPVVVKELTPRQIKIDKIVLWAVGIVFAALMLFLLAQLPETVRRVSAGDMTAIWPPSPGFAMAVFIGLAALFASVRARR